LAEETLRTLALLFPQGDKTSKRWFRAIASAKQLDLAAHDRHLRAEERQIEKFKFWHDRLIILKQVFDESEPRKWTQWWYDRRKGVQRYTFLVAAAAVLLTIIFGLIQSIEGAIQVYTALRGSKG